MKIKIGNDEFEAEGIIATLTDGNGEPKRCISIGEVSTESAKHAIVFAKSILFACRKSKARRLK